MDILPWAGIAEPVSSLSHLIGSAICGACAVRLVRRHQGSRATRISLVIFSVTCILLLSISGIFHMLPPGSTARSVFRLLDHAAIFLFIAGTFTPLHVLLFKGRACWAPLTLVWSIGIVGAIYLSHISAMWGTMIYLGMGWLGAGSACLIWRDYGPHALRPLVAGALFYTLGTVFEFTNRPVMLPGIIGPHELFHFAVLGGIAEHWRLISAVGTKGPVVLARRPLTEPPESKNQKKGPLPRPLSA